MTQELPYRTKTITVEEVTITVRESLGIDALDRSNLFSALSYPRTSRRAKGRATNFVDAVVRTLSTEGLPFDWADYDAEDVALQVAFEGWQALPNNLLVAWFNALYNVDQTTDPKG